jgi:hypothetical protein
MIRVDRVAQLLPPALIFSACHLVRAADFCQTELIFERIGCGRAAIVWQAHHLQVRGSVAGSPRGNHRGWCHANDRRVRCGRRNAALSRLAAAACTISLALEKIGGVDYTTAMPRKGETARMMNCCLRDKIPDKTGIPAIVAMNETVLQPNDCPAIGYASKNFRIEQQLAGIIQHEWKYEKPRDSRGSRDSEPIVE